MNKKNLTSVELAALVNELQFLTKGKLTQIYHQETKELLFQLHAPSKGKCYLKIIPGKFLCLTEKRETPLRPTGFCMQLRKYLDNATINSIQQKNTERIIVFELEKKEKYYLIIELFSKGNLILTNHKYQIITSLERQIWKERTIKPGETYLFPQKENNWKTLTETQLKNILQKSQKKNLATSLATEIGLGGLYAEEICQLTNLNKNQLPSEASPKTASIIKTIKQFLKLIAKPKGFIYAEQITPFELNKKELIQQTPTYNQALNTLNPFEIISPYQQKIKTLEKTIVHQQAAIQTQENLITLNTQKGELIYQKYQPLQKLLDIVKELKKSKDWSEIGKELSKEKKIKKINLKEKKVILLF